MNLSNMYAQYWWNMGIYWHEVFTAWQKFIMKETKNE